MTIARSVARGRALAATTLAVATIAFVSGCSNPSSPGPSGSTSGSASGPPGSSGAATPGASDGASAGSGGAPTPEAAAALALAADPRFARIGPRDPNVIGACCWWSAAPAEDGWTVTIEIGWGDCPAGCIDRHHWIYGVTRAGAVTLESEDGPPVPAGVPPPGGDVTGVIGIRGVAGAGPVCPVVRADDPNCAARPVVGATIHIVDATGTEVATVETDATGAFVVTLPPGRYLVRPDAVQGLMGTPAPVQVEVTNTLVPVDLSYDTGIR